MGNIGKFYRLMDYPIPKNKNLYTYISESSSEDTVLISDITIKDTSFSWEKKCELMNEYIDYINQWSRLFKYIPCVRQVYLCNSITFNALHNNSDIDICIITRSQYLWFARLFSWFVIKFTGLKRVKGKYQDNKKKFCLSFYIDESYTDIYHLRKKQGDTYLSYWLAHTVLLYSDTIVEDNYFIQHNKKLLAYLPNHPLQQSIQLEHIVIKGSSFIKRSIEFIICNRIGRIIQNLIGWIRGTCILGYKRGLLSQHTQKEIIITSIMLKFHEDKRDILQNKRKIASRKEL